MPREASEHPLVVETLCAKVQLRDVSVPEESRYKVWQCADCSRKASMLVKRQCMNSVNAVVEVC
jgi:hypothetical protein